MSVEWVIEVCGQPRPKGSWTITPNGGARPLVRGGVRYYRIPDLHLEPASKGLKAWTNAVQWAAKSCDPSPPRGGLPAGPWECHCTFWFRPPKSRLNEVHCIGRSIDDQGNCTPTGDGDKLERAVWDALTGIFWPDDIRIAIHSGEERYTLERPPGATIRIVYLGDEQLTLW